jgi:hypothetical protein
MKQRMCCSTERKFEHHHWLVGGLDRYYHEDAMQTDRQS